jgi:hypothetical protein
MKDAGAKAARTRLLSTRARKAWATRRTAPTAPSPAAGRSGEARKGIEEQEYPPHVLPLMDFVRRLRAQGLSMPSVDPKGGGIFAKVLFLQDTAGPNAVGTGVITQDNPDPTARNMKRTLDEAGFLRSDVVLWNVVPHYVSTLDQNRNGTPAQIRAAIPYTQAFIDELKSLKVVVFCGRNAQQARKHHLRFSAGVHQLETFHLADRSYSHLDQREDIQATFKRAYDLLGGIDHDEM